MSVCWLQCPAEMAFVRGFFYSTRSLHFGENISRTGGPMVVETMNQNWKCNAFWIRQYRSNWKTYCSKSRWQDHSRFLPTLSHCKLINGGSVPTKVLKKRKTEKKKGASSSQAVSLSHTHTSVFIYSLLLTSDILINSIQNTTTNTFYSAQGILYHTKWLLQSTGDFIINKVQQKIMYAKQIMFNIAFYLWK